MGFNGVLASGSTLVGALRNQYGVCLSMGDVIEGKIKDDDHGR